VEYYSNPRVLREMARYLNGRWIAVHCERKLKDGRPMLIRYHRGKPLSAGTPAQLSLILKALSFCSPRAFYGSAALYGALRSKDDLSVENMVAYTPSWDIDSQPQLWQRTVAVAEAIVGEIARHGVVESVWLKWSGRGMHVHIHEAAISSDVYKKYGPLNVAYSVVEYILRRAAKRIVEAAGGAPIKVENLIDPQRVFTAPLSLHRLLDRACVPLKPADLSSFNLSWTDPHDPRYDDSWFTYRPGEADRLALKAIHLVGGYPGGHVSPRGVRIRTAVKAETLKAREAPRPPKPLPEKVRLVPDPPAPLLEPLRSEEDFYRELSVILSRYALAIDSRPKTLALLRALKENTKIRGLEHLQSVVQQAEELVGQLEPTQLRPLLGPPLTKKSGGITDFFYEKR